jgi:ribosome recycling factor
MDDPEEILLDSEVRMDGAIDAFRRELNGIRTGRAHPSLIENLEVDYYGTSTPMKQLGSINAPEPRMLTVQVWDRNAVHPIEKAIQASPLGINPAIDGQLIRLPIPPLSEERRKAMVRLVHQKAEEARVAVRNVRRSGLDALRKAQKDGGVSEDDLRRHEEALQKQTDSHVALIDQEAARKETDLLEI